MYHINNTSSNFYYLVKRMFFQNRVHYLPVYLRVIQFHSFVFKTPNMTLPDDFQYILTDK